MQVSGKLVILTVLAVAIPAAGASWWFRYAATHGAAQFWGSAAVRLIRDAPQVELLKLAPSRSTEAGQNEVTLHGEIYSIALRRDAAAAPGLTHLRNALLLDRSYDEFNLVLEPGPQHKWRWALTFREEQNSATLLFPHDCKVALLAGDGRAASCTPIARGLRAVFDEIAASKPSR